MKRNREWYSTNRAYSVWHHMRARCSNKNHKDYPFYGGRGITVCERWQTFDFFYEDMGEAPDGMELDREDNSRGYEPGNCRWITHLENSHNTRRCRYIEFGGERLLLTQWAKRLGISHVALRKRLARWPLEKALSAKSGAQ